MKNLKRLIEEVVAYRNHCMQSGYTGKELLSARRAYLEEIRNDLRSISVDENNIDMIIGFVNRVWIQEKDTFDIFDDNKNQNTNPDYLLSLANIAEELTKCKAQTM